MLNVRQILVSVLGLCVLGVGLAGCGQKGALYLPTDPAASGRATLPSLLMPSVGAKPSDTSSGATAATAATPAQPPASAASAPAAASSAPQPAGGAAR